MKNNVDENFIVKLEDLVTQYKNEKLPDAESPFHDQAEIWFGLRQFLEFVKGKEEE